MQRCALLLAIVLSACAAKHASRVVAAPQSVLSSYPAGERAVVTASQAESMTFGDVAVARDEGSSAGEPADPARPPAPDKLVVEAWLYYRVHDVAAAADLVRQLARSVGAKVVSDDVHLDPPTGSLVLRVPPAAVDAVYDGLAQIGQLTQRNVRATDVSKQFLDFQIALDNHRKALARYQRILESANSVQDMLAVEGQLVRVKGEIERLEGELAFLSDRVSLATVTVILKGESAVLLAPPEAKLHPGLGYGYLGLFRDGEAGRHLAGPSLSLHFARAAHLGLSVFDDVDSAGWHADAVRLTLGSDVYSDFLGAGRRRYLNPFLGAAIGVASLGDRGRLELGVTLGVELVKTEMLLVDARVVGSTWLLDGDPFVAVTPSLNANVAF